MDRLTDIWNVKVCRARFSSRGLPAGKWLHMKSWRFSLFCCATRGDECLLLMTQPRLSIFGIALLWHILCKEEARTCEVLPLHPAGAGPFFPYHGRAHALTHLLTTYSLTYSLTHSLTHSPRNSLNHSLTHALTHSLTHSRTHARTHSLHSTPLHCAVLHWSDCQVGKSAFKSGLPSREPGDPQVENRHGPPQIESQAKTPSRKPALPSCRKPLFYCSHPKNADLSLEIRLNQCFVL